ncbi:MAG: hypothetical protein WC547_06635, partial [Candidatus Omnitrophota bacterium]
IGALAVAAFFFVTRIFFENMLLKKIIDRLTAESRIAEVVVTDVRSDAKTNKTYTTIKFLEYDPRLDPLPPKYFTFSGNIIQFQSMVIRFDDMYVKSGHRLKGKSAYIFLKAFVLHDKCTEVFDINKTDEIPSGYEIADIPKIFQRGLWRRFWRYALDPKEAQRMGIKNAQIEAPGTKFVPGMLYTIKIEHDGGMRIDARNLPLILKGEKVVF